MPGPIQSIERAAAILRLLADGSRRLGVSEIADSLGLARGTAHGILRTLQGVGFVEQDDATGKYQLGARLLHLGTSYLDVNELRSRAINWADALAARSGEAVRLGTLLEGKVLVVHHVFRPDDTLQTLDVGALLPLHASALGKVLLAYGAVPLSGQLSGQLPAEKLERRTDKTITSEAALRAELAGVRARGYAITDEELEPGLIAVAAPVHGFDGAVVAALSVSAPTTRMTRDRLTTTAGHCVGEAAGLSAVLGYRQRAARQTRKAGAA